MRQVGPEIGRSKSVPDQAFVINCVDGLKIHMYIKYSVALSSFQLPSLAKVSQRTMLRPWHARSVIVMAKCPQSTLDDHISKHLHMFVLICLLWGTGGKDANPVKMKSANGSISRTLTDEDGEIQEPASLVIGKTITPRTLYEILKAVLDSFRSKDAVH